VDAATLVATRSETDDDRLVARLAQGDEDAYCDVLDRYYPAMLHVAMGFVRSRSAAEEVVQDTWLAVIKGISQFEGRSSFKTWLFRILVNRARTRGSRDPRCVTFSCLDDDRDEPDRGCEPENVFRPAFSTARMPHPDASVLDGELREQVVAAINSLCGRQRQVLVLRDVEGWSPAEICDLLGISEANQRVLLHRARTKVRGLLLPYLEWRRSRRPSHGIGPEQPRHVWGPIRN
jgi:RNA polymerase sigma-70 factor (ECF subfamily)